MSRLSDLYKAMETLRKEGLSLNEDLERQVSELEEDIIKKEILPVVTETIEPALKQVQRELVLVVDYHPGEPISVALSRKAKISEMTGAKVLTPRSSTPVRSEEVPEEVAPHEPTKQVKNPTKGLKVTFPDGTVIWHRQAIDTFIDSLRKIGFERVSKLSIKHGYGYNLVSKEKRPPVAGHIWQHECDGWYIYSNIGNKTKIEDLQLISDHYHLGLKIEEGKPGTDTRKPVIDEEAALFSLPMKFQFYDFMRKTRAESTARSYTSSLDNVVRDWIKKEVDSQADSVFSYTSSEDVRLCIDILNASPEYVKENDRKHHSMSAALNQYLQFIKEREESVLRD